MRPASRQTRNPITKPAVTRPRTSRYKPSNGKSNNAVVKWISGFVVFLIIGFGIRLCNKSMDDKDVLAQMHQVMSEFIDYKENKQYYDSLVDKCHSQAFEKAYRIGGRHRSNTLNEKEYLIEITALMAERARQDGKKDIADLLVIFNNNIKSAK